MNKWLTSPIPGLHIICTGLCPEYYSAVIDQLESMDKEYNVHAYDVGWHFQTLKHEIRHAKIKSANIDLYMIAKKPEIFVMREINNADDLLLAYKASRYAHTILGIDVDNVVDAIGLLNRANKHYILNLRRIDMLKSVNQATFETNAETVNFISALA